MAPGAPATWTANDCAAGAACQLLPATEAADTAAVFKALGDPTRVRLLSYLAATADGTVCACHLPEALGISQPTLSFHMSKLVKAGLVTREQRGRWAHYTVRHERLESVRAFLERPAAGTGCC